MMKGSVILDVTLDHRPRRIFGSPDLVAGLGRALQNVFVQALFFAAHSGQCFRPGMATSRN